MKVSRSSRFKRSFKRLPPHIQDDFGQKINVFFIRPFDPSLNTHRLHGNLASYYAFYLRDGYRVLFEFEGENDVLLVNIGSHDDYRKWERQKK